MLLDTLAYSTELANQELKIPVVSSKRANALERGSVFTAKVFPFKKCNNEIKLQDERCNSYCSGKQDFLLNCFENYTGYVKKNHEKSKLSLEIKSGEYYRFEIVAGPYTKNKHNYYYAVPLRKISNLEDEKINQLDAQDYILIQRLGEFLLGLGWNREIKKHYGLRNNQRNWDWFYKNFM